MRRALPLALMLLGAAPPADRLTSAKREAAEAGARAERLAEQAAGERDAADRAAAEERALRARVVAAEGRVREAALRVALVEARLVEERAALGVAQAPAARLLAGLQSLARRPAVAAVAQPESVDDLVHLRAVIGAVLPAVRARAAEVRVRLAATRRLQAGAVLAAAALRDGRARLEGERTALAEAEARHRGQAQALGRNALSESDRALALGEEARDLVDRMTVEGTARATAADLGELPEPLARPLTPGAAVPGRPGGAYRLPVEGRLMTGFGEVSDAGVRSRGLTFAVEPGAAAVAPAGGVVRYAGRFRSFGTVVIVDHGDGWSTLVTGLAATALRAGATIGAGALIGRAGAGEPRVTVELRRRGQPMDVLALVG